MDMNKKAMSKETYLAKIARGELTPEEQIQWEALLAKHPEWKEEAALLKRFVETEHQIEPQFAPFFVGRVMSALENPKENIPGYLPVAFRWVATPALAMILGGIFYIGYMEGSVSLEILMGLEDLNVNDLLYDALATSD